MDISIKIFGYIKNSAPPEYRNEGLHQIGDKGITIHHLVKDILLLNIDEVTVLVNGKYMTTDDYLRDGDTVTVFSPIAGG